ncbi:MAG TPA: hypothetical protein VHP11_08470, partial [Tepidisphaeraceae bacterium]|nr:hypothetical protein [Tepidisphaeraceae bacterium]
MKTKPILVLLALCTLASGAVAGIEQTINDLIPKLAAPRVQDRYSAQMELQRLAANAARPGAEV